MRFLNENLLACAIAALVAIVMACWLALPDPVQPKTLAVVTEPWALPGLPSHDRAKSMQTIAARNLWGVVAADAAPPPPPPPKWSVMGIVRNAGERFVLLAYEGKPVEMLKVGDALPDGMKVAAIEDDRFFVLTADKKKMAFGIYKNEPTK